MSKIFVTSDHHFDHKKIIEYENRPFNNVNEMNNELIKRWNSVVKKNDIVYHLGDFCFSNHPSTFLKHLNGKVCLILGNHDFRVNKSIKFWYDQGFYRVYDKPIIYDENIILSHEPILTCMHKFNIHGHMHTKQFEFAINNKNVCVELTNYTPIDLKEVIYECSQWIK